MVYNDSAAGLFKKKNRKEKTMKQAQIITVNQLNKILKNHSKLDVSGSLNGEFRLFEIGYKKESQYLDGHIPGATYIDSTEFEALPLWNIRSEEEVMLMLQKFRLMTNDTIVLYDRMDSAAGRFGVLLLEFGFQHVYLLEGGLAHWVEGMHSLSNRWGIRMDAKIYNYSRLERSLIVSYDEVLLQCGSLHNAAVTVDANKYPQLVSIRSYDEFTGFTSGYSYIQSKGHIPTSVHGNDIDFYKDGNEAYVSYASFKEHMASLDIQPDTPFVLYCGTGWRAAEVLFLALTYGYDKGQLYDGGWYEWSEIN